MNFDQYKLDAMKTARFPGRGSAHGISYLALKMAGEAGELLEKLWAHSDDDADLIKEIGDVLWYIAATAHELAIPVAYQKDTVPPHADDVPFIVGCGVHVSLCVARYTEQLGKAFRDDAFADTAILLPPRRVEIVKHLNAALGALDYAAGQLGLTLQEVADINIAKLQDREARGVIGGSGDNR